MFKTIFLKNCSYNLKQIFANDLPYSYLAKIPIFINTATLTKNAHILKTMQYNYYLMCRMTSDILSKCPATLTFFWWATFVSFRPIFILKFKNTKRKAGRQRLKFRPFIHLNPIISQNMVKRWIKNYVTIVKLKNYWKCILFIYANLIPNRNISYIYLKYVESGKIAFDILSFWRIWRR